MDILNFFKYGSHAKLLFSDYRIGGVIFTLFYIFGTIVLPNIYMIYFEQHKQMNKLSLFLWFGAQIFWQVIILYSMYTHLNYEMGDQKGEDIHNYTYNLFVKGGWYNSQKWMSYYAEDVWGDIITKILLSIMKIHET